MITTMKSLRVFDAFHDCLAALRYSPGVIPVSCFKNLQKNEGLAKFRFSAICHIGWSLYFSCSLVC